MTITKPFTVTTTIVTTIDPTDHSGLMMKHQTTMETSDNVELPVFLLHGISQAACEHTIEALMETGIGVEAEIVEEPQVDQTRCPEGNLYRIHAQRQCGPVCDVEDYDVIDVEVVEGTCTHQWNDNGCVENGEYVNCPASN